ncbi:MAG: metallophosphoesterase [Bacteroidales bacterium]|nr:metallophosphoesterase [Bacteroidales bacterium]
MFLRELRRKAIIGLVMMVISAGTAIAQKKIQNAPWFFIQLSDPQFGMFDCNDSFEKETILYEKAVSKINNLKPDFVIITGDFIHDQNSILQINEFKRITAKINSNIPIYYSPGNHDIGQFPDKASLKKYKRNFGGDKFSFKHKGSSFIGFNTSLIKAQLELLEQKQYKWLTKKLRKNLKAQHIIMFCHYPFFNKTVDEPTAYTNIDLDSRKKYLELFSTRKVDVVFSGHYHDNSISSYGKMQLVTTSALGKPLGKAPSGIRIVKVYSDRIEHEYFGLDQLPESVNFK